MALQSTYRRCYPQRLSCRHHPAPRPSAHPHPSYALPLLLLHCTADSYSFTADCLAASCSAPPSHGILFPFAVTQPGHHHDGYLRARPSLERNSSEHHRVLPGLRRLLRFPRALRYSCPFPSRLLSWHSSKCLPDTSQPARPFCGSAALK